MARGYTPKPIPKFTATQIRVANECALLLWNGINFETLRPCVSDKTFADTFYYDMRLAYSGKAVHFSNHAINDLINVAKLKPIFRMQSKMDRAAFKRFLSRSTHQFSIEYRAATTDSDAIDIVAEFLKSSGKAIVKRGVSAKAGYQISLASRILFFALAEYPFFNFADKLVSKELRFQARPHYSYKPYYHAMLKAIQLNWKELSKYNVPHPQLGTVDPITRDLAKTHWWPRRVFDIALLLHFGLASYSPVSRKLLRGLPDNKQSRCKKRFPIEKQVRITTRTVKNAKA